MAFELTVSGTLKDQSGNPLVDATVEMRKDAAVVDTDLTDTGGNYVVRANSTDDGLGDYNSHFAGDTHHTAVSGPVHSWGADANEQFTDNLVTTYSNTNPTREDVPDYVNDEDSGVLSQDFTMGDADGDPLTVEKLSGPSWVTISAVDGVTYRVTRNTDAAAPGDYTASYQILDDQGGSTTTDSFDITINEVNVAPFFGAARKPPDQSLLKDSGVHTFFIRANDNNDDPLTYTKVEDRSWITVTTEDDPAGDPERRGRVAADTGLAPLGEVQQGYRATDPEGLSDTTDHQITIFVGALWPFFTPNG